MTSPDNPLAIDPDTPAGTVESTLKISLPVPAVASVSSLGRRISSRTTDLLAIAIVIIVSLTMGRQMISWWHEEPPSVLDLGPLETLSSEWGRDGRPVNLEFGDGPYRLTRQVLPAGGSQAALDMVITGCQQILVTTELPDVPLDQAETKQLQAVDSLTPVVEQPGNWQLYTLEGRLTGVIGVKTFSSQPQKGSPADPVANRRVICWGLVFPGLTKDSWTAYTFTRKPAGARNSTHQTGAFDLSQLQLPADCRRTILMQEENESGLLGFQGSGQLKDWQQHFTTVLVARGWTLDENWQVTANGQSGRFVQRAEETSPKSYLQVQFSRSAAGPQVGLVHWIPDRKPGQSTLNLRGTP